MNASPAPSILASNNTKGTSRLKFRMFALSDARPNGARRTPEGFRDFRESRFSFSSSGLPWELSTIGLYPASRQVSSTARLISVKNGSARYGTTIPIVLVRRLFWFMA